MTIQANNTVLWLEIQAIIVHIKFKGSRWLKSAAKVLAVVYVKFLKYLSSKSSLTLFYDNSFSI